MTHSLFSVYGVEIEYAVIRRKDECILPIVPYLLVALGGSAEAHPVFGRVELDNELAAHVLEMKASEPAEKLLPLLADFNTAVQRVNLALADFDAALLPGGMHPFMDPAKESRLWDHEDNGIYAAFDRIFGCRGHGWFNIQSVHLNLPFNGDAEFSQLHNAISLILPLLPALAASSPVWDGKPGAWLDGRLWHYSQNQRKLPEISGPLVPEPVRSETEYRERILDPMYRAIASFDSENLLQEEWLNSRAAIARFDRSAIEIRCLDTQECPLADLAICHFTACLLKFLLASNDNLYKAHAAVPDGLLRSLFLESARAGRMAIIPAGYPTELFGVVEFDGTVGGLLQNFLPAVYRYSNPDEKSIFMPVIQMILSKGNLAERMLPFFQKEGSLSLLCFRLQNCLNQGALFQPF